MSVNIMEESKEVPIIYAGVLVIEVSMRNFGCHPLLILGKHGQHCIDLTTLVS